MLSREASPSLPDGREPSEELPEQTEPERYPALHVVSPQYLSDAQRALLKRTLWKRLDDDQFKVFLEIVESVKLNPFLKLIWPDIRMAKDQDGVKHPVLVPITTLQGFRVIGDRSKTLAQEDPVQWCDKEGTWTDVWLHKDPPYAARGSVLRTDRTGPVVTVCLWDAYVVNVFDRGGKEVPNKFWARMGAHMLGKCALVGSYRGAFPDLCGRIYIQEELGEELDPESEAAIEAEMLRRAGADKEHWDKERAKGNLPVNELPPEKNGKKTKRAAAVATPPPPVPPAPQPVQEAVSAPAPLAIQPAPAEPTAPKPGVLEPAWKDFPLTRIKLFAGRTVGSLTRGELRGVRGNWMARVEASWGSVDADIKAHYAALMQRIEHDDATDKAATLAASSMNEDDQRAALDDALNDMQLPFSP